jgi:hypothetical protein
VAYVIDGLATKKEDVVFFKFGKIVYRLTTLSSSSDHHSNRPWWMFWGSGSSSSDASATAQARIASVLGISRGMKVCKV